VRYLPHTEEEIAAMLETVGIAHLDDLFAHVPEACRRSAPLNLPDPQTEWELNAHFDSMANRNAAAPGYKVYLGAGSYDHFIPATVSHLLGRGEFATAYTPYQPEISQGTLQAIYEYQTLTCRLLGMDVANASMYDGASGLAEALLMALRITRKSKVAVSRAIHPLYRQVVQTDLTPPGYEIIELPYLESGCTDLSSLEKRDDLAAVAVQSPNFFGCIEDLHAAGDTVHSLPKTLYVTSFSEPLAYGLLKSPGLLGADIACGEGQSFGIPRSFGGPGLGMFAVKKAYMRKMPGRLIGQTKDIDGKRGFVLTLAAREQHIRREKATSNICSNQGLCAANAVMYMASLGGTGIRELARLNYDKAHYLQNELVKAGFTATFTRPFFNEFTVRFPAGFETTYDQLLSKKIVAGFPLGSFYPELADHYLLCATETASREDLDNLVWEVRSCNNQ